MINDITNPWNISFCTATIINIIKSKNTKHDQQHIKQRPIPSQHDLHPLPHELVWQHGHIAIYFNIPFDTALMNPARTEKNIFAAMYTPSLQSLSVSVSSLQVCIYLVQRATNIANTAAKPISHINTTSLSP